MSRDVAPRLFRVGDIKPSPWRDLARYPVNEAKVAALRESLRTTGFWDNVVARLDENEHPELAYGHHRLIALQREFGPRRKVALIIRDLTDADMIRIMARENLEEFGTTAVTYIETIRSIVEAYAAGHINLRPVAALKPELGALPFTAFATDHITQSPRLSPGVRRIYLGLLRNYIAPAFGDATVAGIAADPGRLSALLAKMSSEQRPNSTRNIRSVVTSTLEAAQVNPPGPRRRHTHHGTVRLAPRFTPVTFEEGMNLAKAYSITDLGLFTGWLQADSTAAQSVTHALTVLETIEQGLLTDADFADVSLSTAAKIAKKVTAAHHARTAAAKLNGAAGRIGPLAVPAAGRGAGDDAARLGRHLIEAVVSGKTGPAEIDIAARESGLLIPQVAEPPPHIDTYARQIGRKIARWLAPGSKDAEGLSTFIQYAEHANQRSREQLAGQLERLAGTASAYAAALRGDAAGKTEEGKGEISDGNDHQRAIPA